MKIWSLPQVNVVPIAIASLRITSKRLKDWLKKLDVRGNIRVLQQSAHLGYQPPTPQKHPPLSCQAPSPSNLKTVQAPLFRQSPSILVVCEPPR